MKFWKHAVFILFLLVSGFGAVNPQTAAAATAPTIEIVAVVKDTSVSIKTANFPANKTFEVRMGKIGTRAVGGVLVGTSSSGSGGALTFTYNIPSELKGLGQISIRLDSTTGGYFSYDWFNNTTQGTTPNLTPTPTGGATATPTRTPTPGTGGAATKTPTKAPTTASTPNKTGTPTPTPVVPRFTIESVDEGDKVTIKTSNFPANQKFEVRMGKMWTQGINGVVVATHDSGSGGSFTATFDIPDSLKDEERIAIRLESKSGYFAYNWFWND